MDANSDINIINDARIKLQGGCATIPGILNDLLNSDKRPLEELNRRIQEETAHMSAIAERIRTIEGEISRTSYVSNEAEKRELQSKIYELNNQKGYYRNSEIKVNTLKNQYNSLRESFENLKTHVYQFKNYDLNSLFDASNGVKELLNVLENYLNIL